MAAILGGPIGIILIDAAVSFAIRQIDTLIASYGSDPIPPEDQAKIDAMKGRLAARLAQVEAYHPLPTEEEPGT